MTIFPFYSVPVDELLKELQSSGAGLSEDVAETRARNQRSPGGKVLHGKQLILLIRQFSNPLIFLLTVAVTLSAVLGQYSDSAIILVILLISGLIGFWQEYHAGKAMKRLEKMIELKYTVLRNGKPFDVPVREVVPGDVLLFDAGDMIPADCRIIESRELHVNESVLTGESLPAEKFPGIIEASTTLPERSNCLWQGTNVISGTAKAIAVTTGAQTIFGSMKEALETVPETSYEKGMRRFGLFLLRTTIVLSVIILVSNLYFRKPLLDSLLFSLALAVGMAPELLPAIMTFAMSAGARRLLDKKVIVKRLSSVFSFGEVNLLCTDKTGTITQGEATVKDIIGLDGSTSERMRLYAYLNASMQNGFANPIDNSIKALNIPANGFVKTDELPYDFIRKRLSVLVQKDDTGLLIMKGALGNVLDTCFYLELSENERIDITGDDRERIMDKFKFWSREGFRVLGLAYKKTTAKTVCRDDERDMIFLGFILLEDPLKESTLSSIQALEDLQVAVKIITGDNRFAAMHTAEKIGLKKATILTGKDLIALDPEALTMKVKTTDIFAEIEPQQKELIVKALQKSGFTVAYIGDGINDVAAIHTADVGISTNGAVDVAKEAADFVLLDKDLHILANGIQEGRKSFVNSMKYVFINTGATFGNMFSVATTSLFLPFLPMLPKQLLLTNLLTDAPFLAVASDHVDDEQLARPGKWDMKMIRNFMIVFGLHSSFFDLLTFYILYFRWNLPTPEFRTGWFLESIATELLVIFVVRTRRPFLKSQPGRLLLASGIALLIITLYLPFSPLASTFGMAIPGTDTLIVILFLVIAYTFSADILKRIFFRSFKTNS